MAKLPVIPDVAPHIERAIHAALIDKRRKETSDAPQVLRMSAAGECERNMWASLRTVPEDDELPPKVLAIFELGHAIETHVIKLLRLSGREVLDHDPESGKQFKLVDFDGREIGHTDGMIQTGARAAARHWSLLEIKSANAKQFGLLLEQGYAVWHPKYADQLQKYMGNAKLPDALAVVYCKDDSRIYAERIQYDPQRFAELWKKASRILNSETLLDRPAAAKSQYCAFCKYCPRNQWCWSSVAGVEFAA